jgi:predicted type IV restriction endonuclease
MDLIDHLQALADRAEKTEKSLTNEDATKMALIAPFLQALGYDIFNPMEVKPEFSADLPGINKKDERVDYAVLENGEPKILVEAKSYSTDLKNAEMGQLSRYFHATKARIGILSNGRVFQFFSDLDDKNKMDAKPFAEIDLFDLQSAPLDQIKQLSKSMFDIDTLLQSAERLKYLRGVKEQIRAELSDPSEWLVKEMARRVHSAERITSQALEKFKPIVIDAIKLYINDRVNKVLKDAMNKTPDPVPEPVPLAPEDAIVTTPEELEGLYIVRAICASEIEPNRLSEKDTKTYCNVLLDQNSWKAIVRLHFNGSKKRVEIFDDAEPRLVPIGNPGEIYQYADRVRAALKAKLA